MTHFGAGRFSAEADPRKIRLGATSTTRARDTWHGVEWTHYCWVHEDTGDLLRLTEDSRAVEMARALWFGLHPCATSMPEHWVLEEEAGEDVVMRVWGGAAEGWVDIRAPYTPSGVYYPLP